MLRRIGLVTALLLCALPASAEVDYGVPFLLPFGQTAVVGDEGLLVGFETMVGDSRCPADAYCVWAGDAEVGLYAEYATIGMDRFSLHTHVDYANETQVGTWSVSLLQVLPIPLASDPPVPADYVVQLVVEPLETVAVDRSAWGSVKTLYR